VQRQQRNEQPFGGLRVAGRGALRRRRGMTLWISPKATIGWAARRRKTLGGQSLHFDLAIETTLMLGIVFRLRLRQ